MCGAVREQLAVKGTIGLMLVGATNSSATAVEAAYYDHFGTRAF